MKKIIIALAASALITAPQASADTPERYAVANAGVICNYLDSNPTIFGVNYVVDAILKQTGFDNYQGGYIIGIAVHNFCPRNQPVLDRYVASSFLYAT